MIIRMSLAVRVATVVVGFGGTIAPSFSQTQPAFRTLGGLTSDCNGNGIEDELDLASVSEDCNINGIPDECDIADGASPDGDSDAVPDECQGTTGVLFVDAAGPTPDPDGSSWVNAYRDIQEALDHAETVGGAIHRINVAEGTYYPSKTTAPFGPRSATFQLINRVAIYGGYSGRAAFNQATQNTLALGSYQRDYLVHFTILSGNIGDALNNRDNSYHVVTASGTAPSAMMDGLIIEGGYARPDTYPYGDSRNHGGGIYNAGGSPTLRNCTIRRNEAAGAWSRGGGLFNTDSASPLIINCTFYQNRAYVVGSSVSGPGGGGGMCNVNQSHPMILDSVFRENTSDKGAGIYNLTDSNPVVERCTFVLNVSRGGGGLFNDQSSPRIRDCLFQENIGTGGAILLFNNSNPTVWNTRFVGNYGVENYARGGAVYIGDRSSPMFRNCLFVGNGLTRSQYVWHNGGAVFCTDDSTGTGEKPVFANCTFTGNYILNQIPGHSSGISCEGRGPSARPIIINCILWGNSVYGDIEESQIRPGDYLPTIEYSLVEGWTGALGGTGNFGGDPVADDPRFVRNADPGPDGEWDGVDDDYGDLRLQDISPCIDAGDNTAVPIDVITDIDGNPRFVNDTNTPDTGNGTSPIVDMGAYEYQSICGNGITEMGEECDDGETVDDDGCSALCTVGPGFTCLGEPSVCVPSDGLCGDLDDDLMVDGDDLAMLLAAFGRSLGDPRYNAIADLDDDGTVTLLDYQLWLTCYRVYIAAPFAAAPQPGIPGDLDADWDVDLADLADFEFCHSEPPGFEFPCLMKFDFDGNGQIDLNDYAEFQGLMIGP